jgi:hypothetical protein
VTRSAPWRPRDGSGLLSFKGRLWLLGGWRPFEVTGDPAEPAQRNTLPPLGVDEPAPQKFVDSAWTVDSEVWATENGRDWECVTREAPWPGRHTAGYAVLDGKMWVVGGDCYSNTDDVWCTDDGISWTCVVERAPWGPGRVLSYTVAFEGALWIIGGQRAPQFRAQTPNEGKWKTAPPLAERFYSDVWRSTDGINWECVCEEAPWGPRGMIGGAAVKDGMIWLLGGGTYETPARDYRIVANDVWRSKDGAVWECVLEQAPWAARQYHNVAVYDNKLFVLGGYGGPKQTQTVDMESMSGLQGQEGGTTTTSTLQALAANGEGLANRDDVWSSSDGVEWHEVDSTFVPRHAAAVEVHGGALWLMAGNNVKADGSWAESDVWKLTAAPRRAAAGLGSEPAL